METEQDPNANLTGRMVKAVRTGAGMSIRSLAKTAGVHHGHLARVEAGERDISPALLRRVLEAVEAHVRGADAA